MHVGTATWFSWLRHCAAIGDREKDLGTWLRQGAPLGLATEVRGDSGIFLPESAKDKPKEGKIVALGNGILNKETGDYLPFTVKKGDAVLFSSYAGTEIKIDGEDLIIMTEEDILAVIG